MKQPLKAGGELDILTAEELRTEIEGLLSGYLRPPNEARPEGGANLSAAGAGQAEIYSVLVGMQFRLTRLLVTVGASSFGVPFAGSGGIDVFRGSGDALDLVDGTPYSSLPQVATWSRSNGPLFRGGERIVIGLSGGPALGQMFVRGMGFLEPLTDSLPVAGG